MSLDLFPLFLGFGDFSDFRDYTYKPTLKPNALADVHRLWPSTFFIIDYWYLFLYLKDLYFLMGIIPK